MQTLSVTFTPTDTTDYTTATDTVELVVNQAPQTINFTLSPSTMTFGVPPIALSATGGASGNPVTFIVTGPATLSGNNLTITGAGTFVVTANQAGSTNYSAATPVSQTIVINQAAPTITWPTPAAITYGNPLTVMQLNVTASVPGTFAYSPGAGTVLGAGPHTLSVAFMPTDATDYRTADVQVTLQVNKATPVIAWTPTSLQLGYSLGAAQLDATASVPGTFVYTPPAGTAITTSSQTLSVVFTPYDTTDYTLANMSVPLTATPGPLASVSPSSIDFGTVYLGTITAKNVTVTNLGTAPMTIIDPLLSIVKGGNSNEFVAVNLCPKSLAVGKSCTTGIGFVAGPFYNPQTAMLSVVDNAAGSPQSVSLTATLVNPQAQLSAMSLNFVAQRSCHTPPSW